LKKRIGRAVFVLAVFYCLLLCLAFTYEKPLVFPASEFQGGALVQVTTPEGANLISLTTPRLKLPIKALYAAAQTSAGVRDPRATQRPTVIFCYGAGSYLTCSTYIFTNFQRMDLNIIMPEYPGIGVSGGSASEEGCYDAADAAYDYVTTNREAKPSTVFATGWSLGSAVAINLAATRRVGGLITYGAFTSLADMSRHRYPFIPALLVRLFLIYHFDNENKIRLVRCPILIAHGDRDDVVPYFMAGRLVRAAHAPVTFVRLHGKGHGDGYAEKGALYPRIAAWMSALNRSAT
jgi:pimeloyl-ACP methyl ester carboxylesterase